MAARIFKFVRMNAILRSARLGFDQALDLLAP
jgi:hypothetical protein